MTKTDVRELALGVLLEVTEQGEFCHIALGNVLEKYQFLEKQERAFLGRLTQGTLERLLELDYITDQFSKVKTEKMKPVIRNILRLSVYQLKYMDSVPDAAVCNEAVKLARKKGFSGLSGFVNGVLRSIARGLGEVEYPQNQPEALSVRFSCPGWIVEKWLEEYGRETTEGILKAFLSGEDTTIRVRLDRISREELRERLEAEGVKARPVEGFPGALKISHYDTLNRIQAFREGLFSVQDVSSMLAVEAAEVKEGSFCLDVCAAPGGKALYLAEKLRGTGLVEARDLTDYKLQFIEENIQRGGFRNVRLSKRDARELDQTLVEQADVVLADLPCSGLGVLGKKPDIRYRASRESLRELASLQREILETVWRYVKPGGVLIYSTCTINREENQENAAWFLEHFPFEAEALPGIFRGFTDEESMRSGMCQLLPGIHGNDGFFIAKFRRKREEKDIWISNP